MTFCVFQNKSDQDGNRRRGDREVRSAVLPSSHRSSPGSSALGKFTITITDSDFTPASNFVQIKKNEVQ